MRSRDPKNEIDTAQSAESISHPAEQYKEGQPMDFISMPDDALGVINPSLTPSARFNLSRTFKDAPTLFSNPVVGQSNKTALITHFLQRMLDSKRAEVEKNAAKKAKADADVDALLKLHPFLLPSQFLQYVVMDDQEKAEDLLNQHPSLLYKKGTAIDFIGRRYDGYKAMPVAYATGNIALYPQKGHRNMADMLKDHFVRQGNGDLIVEQIHEKFPEGTEHPPGFDFMPLFKAINEASDQQVKDALILLEDKTEGLGKRLDEFSEEFKQVSISELRCNPNHLLAAFQLYDTQLSKFKDNKRRKLFAIRVMGCAEACLPACDLKVFAQGLYFILTQQNPRQAGFNFAYGEGNILLGVFSGDLGKKYLGLRSGGRDIGGVTARWDMRVPCWESLCEQKQRAWQTLCGTDLHHDRRVTKRSRCSVM